jgi:hypothetical protein
MKQLHGLFILFVILGIGVVYESSQSANTFEVDILKQIFRYDSQTKSSIDINELVQGCDKPDCVPVLDMPRFLSVAQSEFLDDDDEVLLVDYKGIRKVYPIKIMRIHEIANDYFWNEPVAVAYCGLCATAVAFVAKVNGERARFGMTGLLHNSNMVMYDNLSYTLWGQVSGRGIVGPNTGVALKRLYVALLSWKQAKASYDDLQVLQQTPESRAQIGRKEYINYTRTQKLWFPVAKKDSRLLQKAKVQGFIIDGQPVAITNNILLRKNSLQQTINERQIQITLHDNAVVEVTDINDGKSFMPLQSYWFAWFNFYPQTKLIK